MRRYKLEKIIGVMGAGGLAVLLLMILACPNLTHVHAEEYVGYSDESDATVTQKVGATAEVYVKPMLSIALTAETITLDTAKAVNNFMSGAADLKVATNSDRGFKVLVNSVNNTSMISTDNTANAIPTLTNPAEASAFPSTGGWGYYVYNISAADAPTYQPANTTPTVMKETTGPALVGDYKVGVGVKVDPTTPTGTYRNSLIVSAIANPLTVRNLASITKMQEMTPEICRETPKYVDKDNFTYRTLVDDREERKSYKVGRMADGNCWMLQDLALNLGVTLTPDDSNVSTNINNLPVTGTGIFPDELRDLYSSRYSGRWYYSWDAATAGISWNLTANGVEAKDSICPKGWQLPTIGQLDGSYEKLASAHGITTGAGLVVPPLNFAYGGWLGAATHGGLQSEYAAGYYWTRILAGGNYTAHFFALSSGSVGKGSYYRGYGRLVRCVAVSAQ